MSKKKYITDILDITNDSGSVAPSFSYDPIDVGTFLGTNITASVNAQDSQPEALFFKPDGSKMYIIGRTTDDIFEYDLSTAWDITTISFLQSLPLYLRFFKRLCYSIYINICLEYINSISYKRIQTSSNSKLRKFYYPC